MKICVFFLFYLKPINILYTKAYNYSQDKGLQLFIYNVYFALTGSSDLLDFAITRLQIYWRVLAIRTMFGATVGISRPSQRYMPKG
jgi:hypothetical protein